MTPSLGSYTWAYFMLHRGYLWHGIILSCSDFAYISVAVSLFSSFVIHIPYFAMWTVDYESGRTIPTYFNKSNMDLYYGIVLMVITKAIPIAILILANCLLLWAVRKATFKRKTLHNQTTIQVSLSNIYLPGKTLKWSRNEKRCKDKCAWHFEGPLIGDTYYRIRICGCRLVSHLYLSLWSAWC